MCSIHRKASFCWQFPLSVIQLKLLCLTLWRQETLRDHQKLGLMCFEHKALFTHDADHLTGHNRKNYQCAAFFAARNIFFGDLHPNLSYALSIYTRGKVCASSFVQTKSTLQGLCELIFRLKFPSVVSHVLISDHDSLNCAGDDMHACWRNCVGDDMHACWRHLLIVRFW